jgi:integrase
LLAAFPQCSHITRKRRIYYYRRRLPAPLLGEVTLSLRTTHFRTAEALTRHLDGVFSTALSRARTMTTIPAEVLRIVTSYLKEALDADSEARVISPPATPIYGSIEDRSSDDPVDADVAAIDDMLGDAREALAHRSYSSVAATVDQLVQEHDLPDGARKWLALGLLEANVRFLTEARRRTLGRSFMLTQSFGPTHAALHNPLPAQGASNEDAASTKPKFSELVESFAGWRQKSGVRAHTIQQDRPTLRFFQEIAGDKPVDLYTRGDVSKFLERMQEFPANYGKSPKDKELSADEIIARAKTNKSPLVKPKTAKRHLSALSRFFKFCLDQGLISRSLRDDLVDEHEFAGASATPRQQRDAWSPDELCKLFSSPIWTGSHPFYRTQPGKLIRRDAKFWLPLLALFHGCRLEEFADLYRRDIGCDGGVWFVRITSAERGLKNENADRVVPLHPEMIRCGFLEYAESIATTPNDPLFPDIEPQGADRKRGPRITRWFVNYRRSIGLYRTGVAMHAFRHTANTRLRDRINGYQQERHVSYILGHSRGGGEGRERYDKGPGLKAAAKTLALLTYPELDLSKLYVSTKGVVAKRKRTG